MSWVKPGRLLTTSWGIHRTDLARLTKRAEGIVAEGHVGFGEWMRKASTALRMRGGQALVISDGMVRPADWFEALHVLMMRHLEVKAIQVLSPEELAPSRVFRRSVLVDSETGFTHELAYSPLELARAVIEHNEQLARFCKRNGVPFAQARLDEPLEHFLLKTLPAHGGFLK
jgi:hypothetical protein